MTDETNAALMFTILPSISRVCSGDPETARKLREIFVKTEKHATGFSGDFVAALYDESGKTSQFTYEATMLALSGQDMNEFKGMSQIEEQHPQLRQRADSLKKLLSAIPRIIHERPVFLETIKDIAAAIRELLDVLKDMIRANGRSRTIRDVLERSKRDFVKASKQFSDSLKQYFQERSQRQQSGVFKSANALSQQTNTLLMNMTSVVFE